MSIPYNIEIKRSILSDILKEEYKGIEIPENIKKHMKGQKKDEEYIYELNEGLVEEIFQFFYNCFEENQFFNMGMIRGYNEALEDIIEEIDRVIDEEDCILDIEGTKFEVEKKEDKNNNQEDEYIFLNKEYFLNKNIDIKNNGKNYNGNYDGGFLIGYIIGYNNLKKDIIDEINELIEKNNGILKLKGKIFKFKKI